MDMCRSDYLSLRMCWVCYGGPNKAWLKPLTTSHSVSKYIPATQVMSQCCMISLRRGGGGGGGGGEITDISFHLCVELNGSCIKE